MRIAFFQTIPTWPRLIYLLYGEILLYLWFLNNFVQHHSCPKTPFADILKNSGTAKSYEMLQNWMKIVSFV